MKYLINNKRSKKMQRAKRFKNNYRRRKLIVIKKSKLISKIKQIIN